MRPDIGTQFHRLTVIKHLPDTRSKVLVRCECGVEKVLSCGNLSTTKSCGCLKREIDAAGGNKASHRMTRTGTYKTWAAMLYRCRDQTNKNYGGKGVPVSPDWALFENFYRDMGERPSGRTSGGRGIAEYSLDRIDPSLGYSKENCRWTTQDVQCQNRGDYNHYMTRGGERKLLSAWAVELGCSPTTILMRLRRGDSEERALRPVSRNIPATNDPKPLKHGTPIPR